MGECNITAIISPSQGEDGGSTPLTRFLKLYSKDKTRINV